MRLVPRLTSLWSSLFHKDTLDRDLDEEIRDDRGGRSPTAMWPPAAARARPSESGAR